MIEAIIPLFALVEVLLGMEIAILLSHSNLKFTKGELQKLINHFAWGTIFLFGTTFSQFLVEYLNLSNTPIHLIKHIFLLTGMYYYLLASFEIYKISKVYGFASKNLPEKLKKILKS